MSALPLVRFDSIVMNQNCLFPTPEGIPVVVCKMGHNSAKSLLTRMWIDGISPEQEVVSVRV